VCGKIALGSILTGTPVLQLRRGDTCYNTSIGISLCTGRVRPFCIAFVAMHSVSSFQINLIAPLRVNGALTRDCFFASDQSSSVRGC